MTVFLLFASLFAALGWAIVSYNLLVRDRNRVHAGWSDIDVQLKRRHDLIPRLVEAVRQYAAYEQATLSAVTALRTQSQHTDNPDVKGPLERELGNRVRDVIAIAEQYPDLKASNNFLDLQHGLIEVEDHLQYARRYYNGAVRNFNTRIESFPDLFIARMFGFHRQRYFQLDSETEQLRPEVTLR